MKNDKVKVTAEGGEGMKGRRGENGDSQTGMKPRCTENKNAVLLSVILRICLNQQSGTESSSSLPFKRTVTHSSALHSLATEGR